MRALPVVPVAGGRLARLGGYSSRGLFGGGTGGGLTPTPLTCSPTEEGQGQAGGELAETLAHRIHGHKSHGIS